MKTPSRRSALAIALVAGMAVLAGPSAARAQLPTPAAMSPVDTARAVQAVPAPMMERVATAARVIARGTVLTDSDFVYVDRPKSAQPSAAAPVGVGWVTRRVINTGEILRTPAVEPPIVLTANEMVDATWSDGTVQITIRGVVTRSAALGDHVTIRTADGRHLEAIVTSPGNVRII